jgi:hypothetical protein
MQETKLAPIHHGRRGPLCYRNAWLNAVVNFQETIAPHYYRAADDKFLKLKTRAVIAWDQSTKMYL